MKGLITALGVLCFASAMAYAKTGKFHASTALGDPQASHAQWHRPHSSRNHEYTVLDIDLGS